MLFRSHFWALAILKSQDYEEAGVPMMPNAKGVNRTRLEILIYSLLLAPIGVLPWLYGFASPVYGVLSIVSGLGFIVLAWRVFQRRDGKAADSAAKGLFAYSILYLFLLFGVLVIETAAAIVLNRLA